MDVMEKIVDLLREAPYNIFGNKLGNCYFDSCLELIADHLIAHGVTIQEWIPVTERLPEPFVSVLAHMPGEKPFPTVHEGFISNDGIWQSEMFRREPGEVTHWQPMPQPPKGE